jgi:hypothetical protein
MSISAFLHLGYYPDKGYLEQWRKTSGVSAPLIGIYSTAPTQFIQNGSGRGGPRPVYHSGGLIKLFSPVWNRLPLNTLCISEGEYHAGAG